MSESPRSIPALLDHEAANAPDRPLLKSVRGEVFSVRAVQELVGAAVSWLRNAGVQPEMTVAWQLPTDAPAAVLMLALRRTCTQAAIIHIYRQRDVAAALRAARADVLIVSSATEQNAPPETVVITLPDDWLVQLASRQWPTADVPSTDDSGPKWISFTSGSGGAPKAVVHTDVTLLTAVDGFVGHLGLGSAPDEVSTIAYPIGHIGGIIMLVSALVAKFSVLLVPKTDPVTFPALLTRHHVTVTGGSPAHYQMLLAAQLDQPASRPLVPSLRMLIGGGAACPQSLHRAVRKELGIPIVHAYGMTEAAMICVSKYSDTAEQQIHTSGTPIPDVAVRISNDGEIQVRGSNVTPGYLDPAQWSQATTTDGWFRTGDLGRLRDDGCIMVTGRLKDVIIRKGENISPDVVEQELIAHPRVRAAVVVGVPDTSRGELVCAVVQPTRQRDDLALEELCSFLDQRGLTKQMWPERLIVVDEFPMTGLGKIARAEVARQIGAQS